MKDIKKTLSERGKQYGSFENHAILTQKLKECMRTHDGWQRLRPDQIEALEMIVHKIGRIINGNPDLHDSWHDIAGYATLVADRLMDKC